MENYIYYFVSHLRQYIVIMQYVEWGQINFDDFKVFRGLLLARNSNTRSTSIYATSLDMLLARVFEITVYFFVIVTEIS